MSDLTVALIGGTGNLGIGLAIRLADRGVEVIIGSRDAAKAEHAAARVDGHRVRGMMNPDAVKAAPVIILTVPYAAHQTTLQSIREFTEGKVVVDTTVPLVGGRPLRLEQPPAGSAAEETQHALPAARVVSAFHTVSAEMLEDRAKPLHGDVFLCGNDAAAVTTLEGLVHTIGMRPINAGRLDMSRILEPLTLLLIGLNRRYKRHDLGMSVAGLDV